MATTGSKIWADRCPPLSTWKNHPICIVPGEDTRASRKMVLGGKEMVEVVNDVPVNVEGEGGIVDIESDSFVGQAYFRVSGLASSNAEYFAGKKRKSQILVQGRFKRQITFAEVFLGENFERPFVNIPFQFLLSVGMTVLRKLSPMLRAEPLCEQPYFMSPLVHMCQTIRADFPEAAPHLLSSKATEESNANFGGEFATSNMTASERRQFFENGGFELLESFSFYEDLVYTFQFYQHTLDLNILEIDLGYGVPISLQNYLDYQPLSIMATSTLPYKGRPEGYLWKFDIYHRSLLQDENGDANDFVINIATI